MKDDRSKLFNEEQALSLEVELNHLVTNRNSSHAQVSTTNNLI